MVSILRLAKILNEKQMTNNQLANMLNVSPQYVSEVVNGKSNITIEVIRRIATAIGVSPAALFEGYEPTPVLAAVTCPYCGKKSTIREVVLSPQL